MRIIIVIISMFLSIQCFSQPLLNYPFNGNTDDISGNGYNGTASNITYGTDRFGNANSAAYFNGINSYVDFPNLSQLKPELPVSFSFWIMYTGTSYQENVVFNTSMQDNVSSGVVFNAQSATNKYVINYADGANYYAPDTRRSYVSNNVIEANEWHHITIVVNSGTDMQIYMDCTELGGVYSGTGGNLAYSPTPGCLGRHDRSLTLPPDYFKGYIDDFRYWDRALSIDEIFEECKLQPIFTQVSPICEGEALSSLPTTSLNGIIGSWSPALNNNLTTVYTFTPDNLLLATETTMTIVVNQLQPPSFSQVAPICAGDSLANLPTTSSNGIVGSWSPAPDNTATTTYTFLPNVGQCASIATMTIVVNSVQPLFSQIPSICAGDTLAALPTASNNGITGNWSPAPDNTATTTYTFLPNVGQCASTATMTVVVNSVQSLFSQIPPICAGDTLAALPITSSNGITGSWSPAPDNTATTTYTFLPNVGQCASIATMTIVVNSVQPLFSQIPSICAGDTLTALPTISSNGITGSWSPVPDNTVTTTYTFQPDGGQCASTATITIVVNGIQPLFSQIPSICAGDTLAALPTTSSNGITGSWLPAPDNTVTTTYTFLPDTGQCASTATMTILVNQMIQPLFTQLSPICNGGVILPLPSVSNNGIAGNWSPAPNNLQTTTYSFVPDFGQCASTTTMTIIVNQNIVNTPITGPNTLCVGQTMLLMNTSPNGVWSVSDENIAIIDADGNVTALNQGQTVVIYEINAGCHMVVSKNISVVSLPIPLLKDEKLCIDSLTGNIISMVELNTGIPNENHTFTWFLNSDALPTTTNTHYASQPGIYKVIVANLITGCTAEISVNVGLSSIAIADAIVGQDFSEKQTITVTVTGGSGEYEYQLDGDSPQESNQFTGYFNGEYQITVRDKFGCGELYLNVYALNYPPFFTPNGDGFNDFWTINGLEALEAQIYIFDRYGKLITSMIPRWGTAGWDGKYNGHDLPSTDYWFTLDYKSRNGTIKNFKAHFSLKR